MSEKIDLSYCDTCELRGKLIESYNGHPIDPQHCSRVALEFARSMSAQLTTANIPVMTLDEPAAHEVPAEQALDPFVVGFMQDAATCIKSVQATGKVFLGDLGY